jgi:aryl-alcohol dehydrogenase-like predicted oxidoreductase
MDYRQLGGSGVSVSRLGLGCVTFGREIDEAAAFAVADRAFEAGITLFDTADAYGGGASETVLGGWIAARGIRERVTVCTKVGGPMSADPADRGCAGARIRRNLDASLRRLRMDAVDLYLAHCWDAAVPPRETLEALSEAVEGGKARAIGCSNYAGWQLCRMLWLAEVHGLARMETIQPPLSLALGRRAFESELGPLCADQGVGAMTYSPLGAGFLTGKYGRGDVIPAGARFDVIPGHQPLYFSRENYDIVEGLQRIAAREGVTMPTLAIAWVLRQSGVATTLIGARTPAHIDQAITALEFPLTEELLAELGTLGA